MNNSSSSKLGGQCLIVGAIISFIIFIIQILVSGPPPGNEHIFSYFANETVAKGSATVIYTLLWMFGNVLIAFGILVLNGHLQEQQKDTMLSLGTFLFIVGQIGFMLATTMDVSIIYAQDPIEIANIASGQMSIFFMFGPVAFLGGALVSLNLASREYINALYSRITAVVFLIVILAFIYSSFNMADPGNHNIPSTIMPAFAGISIAQFFAVIWNLMVGMKMMRN
jgi:hypothetical protein